MRFRLIVAFLVGVAFFTVLPHYEPFIVMQSSDIPLLFRGLGASVVAGAALASLAGPGWRGFLFVLACAVVGASLYVFLYEEPPTSSGYLDRILNNFVYLFFPATVGVGLMVLARSLVATFRRS
jgi:hypothetical protein